MEQSFTQEDLIRFIYGEVSADEHIAIFEAIDTNPEIRAEYDKIQEVLKGLDSIELSPSDTTIQILNEESSESSSLETY
jgi:hypothetical protein